ncbi:SGNH/GDSL hydrolase family protein [Actinoplanes sp. NPDC049118]|uniref:SGNH/GDSL hydrolase family protein n=1 Tax=Actinoplanes sp. NPDC049118 TaxID=3155769 RepID=UPI0033DCB4BC
MGVRRVGFRALTSAVAAGLVAGLGTAGAAKAEPGPPAGSTEAKAAGFTAMRVMPLGDSITVGTGGATRTSYRIGLAYRLLKAGLQIDYVGSQDPANGTDSQHEGHGGWTIEELSAKLDGWLAESRPDVVLVHAGTNDITQGKSPGATARRLSAMIDQIRAARPEAHIFVAQIVTSRVPRERAADGRFNELIPAMVAEKDDPLIKVVDQSTVAGIDLHDLRHPNDFGYSKMAYNWYRSMAPVFQISGDTGPNPYRARSTFRCLRQKFFVKGKKRHRTECRTWKLRTAIVKKNGVNRRIAAWQTLRKVKRSYRVRVHGKVQRRTRLVKKWTGTGNLLNV